MWKSVAIFNVLLSVFLRKLVMFIEHYTSLV